MLCYNNVSTKCLSLKYELIACLNIYLQNNEKSVNGFTLYQFNFSKIIEMRLLGFQIYTVAIYLFSSLLKVFIIYHQTLNPVRRDLKYKVTGK